MSTHYFSCSGESGADPELVFCIQIDQWITYYVQLRQGRETLMNYFSCSSGLGADPIKSAPGHVTGNLCFCSLCNLHFT
jgi:hypothetical protein